jgi:hypothetical protein
MNTHFPVKKGLMALAILCIVSFVLLSGCTSGLNTPSVSTGEKGYSDSSGNYATPAYGGTQTAYATPMPTSSAGSVYTNVNDRKVIMTASVSMETGEHDKVVTAFGASPRAPADISSPPAPGSPARTKSRRPSP